MPEGPEVARIGVCLNRALEGAILEDVEWDESSRVAKKGGISKYDPDLFPSRIISVWTHGKHIFFHCSIELDSELDSDENHWWIHCHLGMEGHWVWEEEKHSNLWMNVMIEEETRVLFFNDSRHFGVVEFFTEADKEKKLSELGPDLLREEISLVEYRDKVRSRYVKKTPLADWLLNQKYFAGVGNYLRAEILYAAELDPRMAMADLDDEDIEALWHWSVAIIREAFEANGLTIATYWDLNGEKGSFQVHIYKKKTCPQGFRVETYQDRQKRTVHWVPEVQARE